MTRNNATPLGLQCILSTSDVTYSKSDIGKKVISPKGELRLPELRNKLRYGWSSRWHIGTTTVRLLRGHCLPHQLLCHVETWYQEMKTCDKNTLAVTPRMQVAPCWWSKTLCPVKQSVTLGPLTVLLMDSLFSQGRSSVRLGRQPLLSTPNRVISQDPYDWAKEFFIGH